MMFNWNYHSRTAELTINANFESVLTNNKQTTALSYSLRCLPTPH